jgi:putative ABC transport system permease protein
MYVPHQQDALGSMMVAIRAKSDPQDVVGAARGLVAAKDRSLALAGLATMTEVSNDALASFHFVTLVMTAFGATALILALVGIYGVVSYSVSCRTNEIGIRMALGAQARDVRKLVLRQGLTLTLVGVASGLACTVGLIHVLGSLLYEISATDPLTLSVVTVVLTVTALVASYLPARRATKVDPMVALRCE